MKKILSTKPVLSLYRLNAETELHTDASMHGYGAILLQREENGDKLHPVYYASGKATAAESRYSSYELEVLAIVKALRKFHVYLLGIPFKIVTDCQACCLTMSKRDLCVRVARWAMVPGDFQYIIENRPGKNMTHVDALSRNPLPSSMVADDSEESVCVRISKAQREDCNLKGIMALAERDEYESYVMKNGLLFKVDADDVRLVVPKVMQSQIVKRVHENGHSSAGKTESLLKRDYVCVFLYLFP